jgi:hypothetical protein
MLHHLLIPLLAPDDGHGGGGGGAAGGASSGGTGGDPASVPYDRFKAVVTDKNNLVAENARLESELQKLIEKAATVDTLSGEVNRWKTEAETAKGRFVAFTEFSEALGISDAEVIETFDARYRSLAEKDRPTRKVFVEELRGDLEKAPTLLRPWLTPSQTGSVQSGLALRVSGAAERGRDRRRARPLRQEGRLDGVEGLQEDPRHEVARKVAR